MQPVVVRMAQGAVELATEALEERPLVVVFPGGHCGAMADVGWDLFRELGYGLVSVSRPGYGRTQVGPLSAAEFVPAVSEALAHLGVRAVAAVVGVSFGGMQAIELTRVGSPHPPKLILASAAPSTLPYPDSPQERIAGSLVFSPRVQTLTWRITRALVASDQGLKLMVGGLSTLPIVAWWNTWSQGDCARARAMFSSMNSGAGFVLDLRQASGRSSGSRQASMSSIDVPTLVLASRHDGVVAFAHAENAAAVIPGARLVDTEAASHLFWLGPTHDAVRREIDRFLSAAALG
ncbi:alpha/beta fold hydrolase [Luteococcus sp. OSA5]|uniref:alpha/beta fold hydrolase n=1 Tax=Luteococcus sp. OSA5 TaxID=3401630 RepID=UPI003B42FC60